MIIREATEKDATALARLAQDSYRDAFGPTLSDDDLQAALASRSAPYFRSVLGQDGLLLAEDEGGLVGFIQFGPFQHDPIAATAADVELRKLYIRTSSQGKGIGSLLMEAMLSHERLAGGGAVYLDVFADNERALALYRKYGFEVVGTVPFMVEGKVVGHDWLMKRERA